MAPKLIDITGSKYRFCIVLGRPKGFPKKYGVYVWDCKCVCGKRFESTAYVLKKHDASCGCKKAQSISEGRLDNDLSQLRQKYPSELIIWRQMRSRCYRETNDNYDRYGGRGIRISKRWSRNFKQFIEDMGPRPSPRHSLDRKNNDGHYTPKNCRWATPKTQSNNRSSNIMFTHKGKTRTLQQWADKWGISRRHVRRFFGCKVRSDSSEYRRAHR